MLLSEAGELNSVALVASVLSLLLLASVVCLCCQIGQWLIDCYIDSAVEQKWREPREIVVMQRNGVPIMLTLVPEQSDSHFRILQAVDENLGRTRVSYADFFKNYPMLTSGRNRLPAYSPPPSSQSSAGASGPFVPLPPRLVREPSSTAPPPAYETFY